MTDDQKKKLRFVLKQMLSAIDTLDEASTFRNIPHSELLELHRMVEELTS